MKNKLLKNALKVKRIIKMAILGVAFIFSVRTTIDIFNAEVITV